MSHSQSHTTSPPSSSPFLNPNQAQENFASQHDLGDPMAAISSYARIMREHTQRQMDLAHRAASRRSPTHKAVNSIGNLTAQSSIESTDSRGNA